MKHHEIASAGGRARAKKLSREDRKASASRAANARWSFAGVIANEKRWRERRRQMDAFRKFSLEERITATARLSRDQLRLAAALR